MRSTLRPLALACAALALAACDEDSPFFNVDFDTGADAGADGGVGDADDAGADVREVPVIDFTGLTEVTPRFAPTSDSWYATPWPSDARTLDDGTVDLTNFPNADLPLIQGYRATMEGVITGFSVMPVVYVNFDGDLPFALPDPPDTLAEDSVIQLVDVSDDGCGTRIPVESRFVADESTYIRANTLMVSPVPGFVLRPSTPYALIVMRTLGYDDGYTAAPAPGVAALLDGSSNQSDWNASFAPLRGCMDRAGLFPSLISVASVFTTQDAVAETQRVRDAVVDPDLTPAPEITGWIRDERNSTASYDVWAGIYETPIYMTGTSPYAAIGDGGSFGFDASGAPEIQRWEQVPMSIAFPTTAEPPFPVLVWEDGTGAGRTSHLGDPIFLQAIARGFAIANFQPQFHGGRGPDNADEELHSFNYLNPEAGRTVFRQQAVDTSYFVRVLREATDGLDGLPELDTSRLVYGGHSQGAIVGALVAGIETEFDAYFFNGQGAQLAITIVERKDPFDIAQLISNLLQTGPLTRFHPVCQMAQMGADAVDPGAYAWRWSGYPANPGGVNALTVNGDVDDTTHVTSVNAMTISAGMAPLAPSGWDVDPWGVWQFGEEAPPISGNRTALDGTPITLATFLKADSGHFTIYRFPETAAMGAAFLRSAIDDNVPTVEAP